MIVRRLLVMAVLAVAALPVTASAASADGVSAGDVGANVNDQMMYAPAPTVDSIAASDTVTGTWGWDFEIEDYTVAATNPMIEVDSGLPLTDFPALASEGFTSFPVFGAPQATLSPGDTYFPGLDVQSTIPVTFSTRFDAARTITPTTIPAAGVNQQVDVTVTAQQVVGGFKVAVDGGNENAILVSSSPPANLNQGEILGGSSDMPFLLNPVVGKSYTFTFTLSVPNPYGTPFLGKPYVTVTGQDFTGTGPTTTNALAVPDPPLDGQITYSIDQTATWGINHFAQRIVQFQGSNSVLPPTTTEQCKHGGWQLFGTFKNQGDCVGYVATGGKNLSG